MTRREIDLIFEGRLTHVTLDTPLARGPLFFALSDQIVAAAECRQSQRISTVSEWHQRYVEHRNTTELLPHPNTHLAELRNLRRLRPFLRLTSGPPRTLLFRLGAHSVTPARIEPPNDEPATANATEETAVRALPTDDACSSTLDPTRVRITARAMGASPIEAALAAGAITSTTDRGASELPDSASRAEGVRKRPASTDLRDIFRRQRADASDE